MGRQINIEEAVRLAEEERRCYNVDCPDYRRYNQCENHSYVLCPQFAEFYEANKDRRTYTQKNEED